MISRSQFGKDVAKRRAIVYAHVRWNLHAGENDLRIRVMVLHAIVDGLQVGGSALERNPPKAIVSAQLQYEDGHGLL